MIYIYMEPQIRFICDLILDIGTALVSLLDINDAQTNICYSVVVVIVICLLHVFGEIDIRDWSGNKT